MIHNKHTLINSEKCALETAKEDGLYLESISKSSYSKLYLFQYYCENLNFFFEDVPNHLWGVENAEGRGKKKILTEIIGKEE